MKKETLNKIMRQKCTGQINLPIQPELKKAVTELALSRDISVIRLIRQLIAAAVYKAK